MKNLFFVLALFISLAATAQTYTDVPGKWRYFFVKITDGFAPPQDTLSTAPVGAIAVKNGVMYVKGVTWVAISGAGGSGVWGSITGVMGNQTDLIDSLGTKMDSSKRTMDTLYAITDTTLGYYIHGQFRTFKALGALKSFNGRNGAIVLTQADVIDALGYTPKDEDDSIAGTGYLPVHRLLDSIAVMRSLIAAGSSIDTTGLWVYVKDSATVYVTHKNLSDSSAALRSLISSGFDSSSSQGGGFHTEPYNDARYFTPFSTTTPGIVTPAGAFNSRAFLRTDNTFQTVVIPTDTTGKWLGYLYRSHDSVYACKGNPTGTHSCVLAYIDSVGGGGGGTIGGSIASGQVGYGSGSNTLTGESAFTYNSSTNTLVSDTASHLQVIANGAVQHPLQVKPNYGGYAGIIIDNQSSSNSAANRLYLASGAGAYKDSGLQIYQLPQGFAGGWNYGVVREVGSGGLILASNNAPMYFETGTPGVDNAYLGAAFNTSKNWIIGPDISAGDLTDVHGVRLMVNGAFKARDSVVFCDNGGGFANIYAGHYRDQGYLQDVGFQFYNRNATSPFIAFRINPNASLFSNYYKTSATTTGYTRLAVAFDGSGNMQQKQIFDSTSGTANPDQILYYEGAPTSSANFKYSPTNKTFSINYGSGGTIFADSLRLYKGYLMLNDEGHNYTFIKALNYLNNPAYVEGVGIKFQTIKQGNSAIDAFRIDSAGEIKIPQSPKSAASTDSVLFRASSDGSIHQTTIARLATLMGLSGGISRIAPLDSLAKDAKGAQVSGVSFVPQTADGTYPGLISTGAQTIAGVKTFSSSPIVPTPSPNDNSTNAASTAYVDAAVSAAVGASGKYLPTITNVSNAAAITSDTAMWIRSGDNVFVDGKFDITPTSGSVNTSIDIVLPVNSSLLGGHACWGSGMTSQTTNGGVGCVVTTSTSNKARLTLYATGQTTSLSVYYHLQYNVQ